MKIRKISKKVRKKIDPKILIGRKNIFQKSFFDLIFYFRKLRERSFLTSCWTPPNSFRSLRTSYLNPRDPIFYQGKPGAPSWRIGDILGRPEEDVLKIDQCRQLWRARSPR